ncbi:fungal-specific transcription factor domain-containing protein [Cladochytrium replicatum]|nr:fungal-specific transcription factor domain-containing protein [Cladochytrium replicatum]
MSAPTNRSPNPDPSLAEPKVPVRTTLPLGRACLSCRSKKKRCDALLPSCTRCADRNEPCIYSAPQESSAAATASTNPDSSRSIRTATLASTAGGPIRRTQSQSKRNESRDTMDKKLGLHPRTLKNRVDLLEKLLQDAQMSFAQSLIATDMESISFDLPPGSAPPLPPFDFPGSGPPDFVSAFNGSSPGSGKLSTSSPKQSGSGTLYSNVIQSDALFQQQQKNMDGIADLDPYEIVRSCGPVSAENENAPPPSWTTINSLLDSPDTYTLLLEYFVYSQVFSPAWMIHRETFFASVFTQPVILRLAMCALSARFGKHCISPEGAEKGEQYYQAARTMVHSEVEQPTVGKLQGILLLSIYAGFCSRVSVSWVYLGLAARMISILQLDKDPGNLPISWIEKETRRRTFWSVYFVDVMVTGLSGRKRYLSEKTPEVKYPGSELVWECAPLASITKADIPGGPQLDGLFVVNGRLTELIQRVMSLTRSTPKPTDYLEYVRLEAELLDWYETLPEQYRESRFSRGFSDSIAAVDRPPWLCICMLIQYYGAICMLHRPWLVLLVGSNDRTPAGDSNSDESGGTPNAFSNSSADFTPFGFAADELSPIQLRRCQTSLRKSFDGAMAVSRIIERAMEVNPTFQNINAMFGIGAFDSSLVLTLIVIRAASRNEPDLIANCRRAMTINVQATDILGKYSVVVRHVGNAHVSLLQRVDRIIEEVKGVAPEQSADDTFNVLEVLFSKDVENSGFPGSTGASGFPGIRSFVQIEPTMDVTTAMEQIKDFHEFNAVIGIRESVPGAQTVTPPSQAVLAPGILGGGYVTTSSSSSTGVYGVPTMSAPLPSGFEITLPAQQYANMPSTYLTNLSGSFPMVQNSSLPATSAPIGNGVMPEALLATLLNPSAPFYPDNEALGAAWSAMMDQREAAQSQNWDGRN